MSTELRFDGRVVVITGAGNGLGRSHALLFGSRGAKVVVNDLGGGAHGEGKSSAAADGVVNEIRAAGGEAVANYDSVEDGDKIIETAIRAFGRVDILVNNAGILRDTSFQKMSQADWDLIYRVHVLGAFKTTQAAWNHMREGGYGRILVTSSAAGIYGNFGQANYSVAKLGLVGLSNTLAIEGRKKNVLVNAIAPIAGSRMTETVLPKELLDALKPEYVSPLVAWLAHESCTDSGGLYEVGGGLVTRLRWERTVGHTFRLGRVLTPEAVRDHWNTITDFGHSTHPEDITQSMGPIVANIQAGPGRGGNAFIDADAAVGYEYPTAQSSYEARDLGLYALAVGASEDPLDAGDLQMTYELHTQGFRPLPTFAVVPALNALVRLGVEGKQAPGLHYGFERILHGEQYLEILRPLPTSAALTHKITVKDVYDKGKNALVVNEIRTYDPDGRELFRNEVTSVVRGAGGWGGDRGPATEPHAPPARDPDAVVNQQTHANQALLYRLLGDWNPLHADPDFAVGFGFTRPILHGLCTFGYAARHVIRSFAGNDPRLFKSIRARFTDTVIPGETLRTEMWKTDDTHVVFQSRVVERGKIAITGVVEVHREIPSERPVAAPAVAARPTATAVVPPPAAGNSERGGAISTQEIFGVIRDHIAANPGLVSKVATVFVLKLSGPDSAWTLDVKNAKGAVTEGVAAGADVTLSLADEDWHGIVAGKVDAQKLYFGGKLKISGNLMASQKLEFLKQIDPAKAAASVAAQRGAPTPKGETAKPAGETKSAGTTATKGAVGTGVAAGVFEALKGRLKDNPGLVGEVRAVMVFNVREPAGDWVIDLKNPGGSVRRGTTEDADATMVLADEDLGALVNETETPQRLFQTGRLRVLGDVRVAQRLGFLRGLKAGG